MEVEYRVRIDAKSISAKHCRKNTSGNIVFHPAKGSIETKGGVTALACTASAVAQVVGTTCVNVAIDRNKVLLGLSLCTDEDTFSREFGFYSALQRAAASAVQEYTGDYCEENYTTYFGRCGDEYIVAVWHDAKIAEDK